MNYWPQVATDGYHKTDMVIQRSYHFTVGCPANLIPRIFSECCQVAPVVVMWNWALVARVGAVEVSIRQNLHGSEWFVNTLHAEGLYWQ